MRRRAWLIYQEVLEAARRQGLAQGEEQEVARALLDLPREAFLAFARAVGLEAKYLRYDLLPIAFLPNPLRQALAKGLPLREAHRLARALKRGKVSPEDLAHRPLEAWVGLGRNGEDLDPRAPVWLFPPETRKEALPQGVARALVGLYTERGELVVDPMAGYGTVVEAARALGRRAWGGDIDPKGPLVERADIRTLPERFQGEAALLVLHPPTFASWLASEGHREPPEDRYAGYIEYLMELLRLSLEAVRPGGKLALVVRPRREVTRGERRAGRDFFLSPFERALAEVDPRLRPFRYHLAVSRDGREDWHLFVGEVEG